MSQLQTDVNATLASTDGTWSVYVKDLKNDTSFTINDQPLYAASLIKLFVLESSYKNYHQLLENAGGDTAYLNQTLSNMITVSDNEAFNELVRLHSDSYSFNEGCQTIEDWLKSSGEYPNTNVYHSLEPSNTPLSYISVESNTTSAADCGKLLEKIYKGTCVSENASADMLSFLKAQEKTGKIPAGLPEGTVSANKTGETDTEQHDAAIVYGDKTDYVICIMSSGFSDGGAAVSTIQTISSQVYNALEGTGA